LRQAVTPAGGGQERTGCFHGHILSDVPRATKLLQVTVQNGR